VNGQPSTRLHDIESSFFLALALLSQYQVSVQQHAYEIADSHRQRLLADLVDCVLRALTGGDGDAAVGVHAIGRGQLGTDADHGRNGGTSAPVPTHAILQIGPTWGVGRNRQSHDRRAVRSDQPRPHQQNAALAIGNLAVVLTDQARAASSPVHRVTQAGHSSSISYLVTRAQLGKDSSLGLGTL